MKLLPRLLQSRKNDRTKHLEKEQRKLGVLRAGSTGMLSEEGEIAGACHRVSHLRSKGIEVDPPTDQAYIMFELGYANEDVIYKQIVDTLAPGESVLREEEIPISWKTSNGTLVTGRPDIVICRGPTKEDENVLEIILSKDNPRAFPGDKVTRALMVPVTGIELKSVHSLWTARDVLFGLKPKLPNLAQAAHYMWKLGLSEYKLMYKSYSQLGQGMAGNEWITKMFPKPGEPGSEYVDYTESERNPGKYTIKHIKQFEIVYDLSFDKSGRLRYKPEGIDSWTSTVITRKSIEDYFELVSKIESTKDLGPRPSAVDAVGKKLSYTQCKYCPLNKTCTTFQSKGYDKWMEEVLVTINLNKNTKDPNRTDR